MKNLFEKEIQDSIEYYQKNNDLIGEKIWEKVPFGKSFSLMRSKFDFWALIDGVFYALECKYLSLQSLNDSISFSGALDKPQTQNLLRIVENGGYSFILFRVVVKTGENLAFAMKIWPLLELLKYTRRGSFKLSKFRELSFVKQLHLDIIENKKIWRIRDVIDVTDIFHDSDRAIFSVKETSPSNIYEKIMN